jgi:predicted nucleic acid-binding protein
MKPYADTNFLVRCYLRSEALPAPRTDLERLQAAGGTFPVTWVHRLEVPNAFQLHVFAWKSLGQTRVTGEMAAAAQARFQEDCVQPASILRPAVIGLADLERHFLELCLRHTGRHGFRTYDLLHVTSALLFGCDEFWSFDLKATHLARLEGMKTLRG